MTESTD